MTSALIVDDVIDDGVNWQAPWLADVREIGQHIARAACWRDELNRCAQSFKLCNQQGLPIVFVSQVDLPENTSYEAHIFDTGRVPTRDNLHDFFNALIWLTFPQTKVQLNALQAAQIAQLGIGKSRGPARDAATLFDENAALLAVNKTEQGRDVVSQLRHHQWHDALFLGRDIFAQNVRVFSFGHALLEKCVRPYKAITAHTFVCWVEADFFGLTANEQRTQIDKQCAQQLRAQKDKQPLTPADFSHLPILGVPNWWQGQNADFYADSSVFRPAKGLKNS